MQKCALGHRRWLGMDPLDWHRLDNVFASTAVCCLFVYLMDTRSAKTDECLRLCLMTLILWCATLYLSRSAWRKNSTTGFSSTTVWIR